MTAGRVYLPMSAASLRRAREAGHFGPAPLRGHAVTPAVVEELPDATEEEREYSALTAAALDSLTLVADEDPQRRMVAAVDVAAWEPATSSEGLTAVVVGDPVPLRRLASVLVDTLDAEADVAAARRAEMDSATAAELVERCLEHDLGWYAAQELDQLLDSW